MIPRVLSVKSSESNGQGMSNLAAVENPTLGGLFQWKKNWKFSFPNKLQMFAWRLAIIVYPFPRKFRVEDWSWTPFGLSPCVRGSMKMVVICSSSVSMHFLFGVNC
jgi:hypothetical protein